MQDRLLLVATMATVGVLLACGAFKKVEQCNALVDKINTAQQAARRADSSEQASAEELKKLAGVLEQLAKDIGAMDIKNEKLRGYADEYQQMVSQMAAASRKLIAAVEAGDLAGATAAKAEMDAVSAKEDGLVAKINGFCGAQ
jgi:chromosome segregation ATPase